jgi:hypothetical protein
MANKNGNGNGHKKRQRGPRTNLKLQAEPIVDATEETLRERIPIFPDREAAFIDAYFRFGCNATRAAAAAGWSQQYARFAGPDLLRRADIRDQIVARLNEHHAGAEEVLGLLSLHLRADLGHLLNDDGEFDWALALKRGVTRMIKKLKIRKHTETYEDGLEATDLHYEIELHDSQAAARTLVGILGLEQRPKENETDYERKAKMYGRMVDRVIERMHSEHGEMITRAQAIDTLAAYQPEIREYIN